jgi:spermidine synthase
VCVIFAVSGASGLIYELTWVRMLSALLGGTTFAIGAVLASFMAGLAVGSRVLGKWADRAADPLRLYAGLELGVAVSAAAVPVLLAAAKPLYVALAHLLPPPALAGLRVGIAVALLLLPTAGMGGTLPVLSRVLVRNAATLGSDIGLLYGVNTLGAMAGALLGAFALIPAAGLVGATAAAIGGNLLAAGAARLLGSWIGTPSASSTGSGAARSPVARTPVVHAPATAVELGIRTLAWVFGLSGFTALGFELYWTRALHHFLGNTTYAFGTMVATFLFGLAAGGWIGGRLADRAASPARALGWVLIGVAVTAAATVPMLWNVLPHLDRAQFFNAPTLRWSSYLSRRFVAAFAVMTLPTLLAGATLPLVARIGITTLQGLGAGVGRLMAANTCGAIVGSLAAAWVVLPLLGVRGALLATALLAGGVGAGVHVANRQRAGRDPVLAGIVLAALAVLAPGMHRRAGALPSDTQGRQDVVMFEREDATAETRVYRKPNGEQHMSVDGRDIGGTDPGILRKQKLLAHLPVALVPRAERVLAVGLGSGITLGTLGLYDEIRALECVEIVPGVIAGAACFRDANHDVLRDARVHVAAGDGVQYLLTTREKFDVISSDSKLNPEYAGNGSILSREYYDLCREHLTLNGVMVQWVSVHIPESAVRLVTHTFVEAFPYVELFWFDPGDILMAGSPSPIGLDLDRWQARSARPAVRTDLESLRLQDAYVFATSRVSGRDRLAAELAADPVNTWLRPTYEFRVVRDFRLKAQGYHESDNLRWLAGLWSPEDFRVAGEVDRERLARFQDSTHELLLGFATGGGMERLAGGRAQLAAGLARNPEDERLARLLQRLDREAQPTGAGAEPASAADWLQQGVRALDAGRAAAALECFDRAAALDPGSVEARYDRLLALTRLSRNAEFRTEVARFTRDFAHDARGWSMLGQSQAESGDLQGSLAAFRRAVELDPSTAPFHNNLAVTLAQLGKDREAAEAFARVYTIDPLFPDAAYLAAAAYSRAGDTHAAAQWMDICIERKLCDPTRFLREADFAHLRASSDWQQGRIEAASREWPRGSR